jgi:Flp pilus assembly protein TadD
MFAGTIVEQKDGTEFARGVSEFRAGRYAESAKIFDQVETQSPGSTEALLFQGKALIHLEDFAEAEESLRKYHRPREDSS